MDYKPDIMLYHANCADGFGAAWAVWKRWGDSVEYVPCSYGQAPPDVLGKRVLIGDFSYKREQMDAILQGAASVVVLDHHETAEAELTAFLFREAVPGATNANDIPGLLHGLNELNRPPALALFDMQRSGAVMTWQFCHPAADVPMLLKLVQDRDLWRFTMPMTKPFGVWLRCEPFDFARWDQIAELIEDPEGFEAVGREAFAMQRFFDQKVTEIGRLARRGWVAGREVPVCNCPPMFASDVGHWLLDEYPFAEFVVCYSDQGKTRGYSLRSRDDRMNVAEIAAKFGGGGHRNAAGFGVPLP